jgi:hypothetical protein
MTLGRYLSPTDPEAGSVLTAKILTYEGIVIQHNTFRHLTHLENENQELITAKANFTANVNSRLGEPIKDHLKFNELDKISSDTLPIEESVNLTNMSHDPEVMDSYLTAEVLLPKGDMIKRGKVIWRLTDDNNLPI